MALTRPTLNQINTTITALDDPITVVNKARTSADIDTGFIFNRDGGATANVAVIWDETNDQFALVTTSSSGATNANVTISDYADLKVGSAFVDDVLRIAQNASGLRMTNVGAFDNDGSDNFRIFATNDLILAANGESGTAITIDATNSNVAVSNDLTVSGELTVDTVTTTGNLTVVDDITVGGVTGNLIPSANVAYSLGDETHYWSSLFLSGGTIYLGNVVLKEDSGSLGIFETDGTTPATLSQSSVDTTTISNGTSNVAVISSGANVVAYVGGTEIIRTSVEGLEAVSGNIIATNYFIGDGSQLTNLPDAGNAFTTISVSGQSDIVADSSSDTLALVAGTGIAITSNATSDTLTFSTVSAEGAFADDADFGLTTDSVTLSEDLGDLDSTSSTTYDLGTIISAEGLIYPGQLVLPQYTVGTLPSASVTAQLVYVSDETGGATLAFSDGTNWRRVQDRNIVS